MRIIAGRLKGRRLEGPPPGPGVRPTSDGLRETLFNVLGGLERARVLDAFAGTGAVGLEALSRGAGPVTFVERDRRALGVLEANIRHCGVESACVIIRDDFSRATSLERGAFDLVFLDPPYEDGDLEATVRQAAPLVAPGGRLVVEHSRRRASPERAGALVRSRVLVAGDSALSFYTVHSEPMTRIALFPGSFDPLTSGHVDLIARAGGLFDRVVVAVLVNTAKTCLFTADERVAMAREACAGQPVDVETFDGLLVELARRRRAVAIIRGLRGASDFDYERQMAVMNRHLNRDLDTVFLLPAPELGHISSTLVKEIAALGGSLTGLVPPGVEKRLHQRREDVVTRHV